MLGSKQREIARLKRLVASLRTRLKGAEKLRDTAIANQARIAQQQANTFRVLARQVTAARDLGEYADARAVADDLVEQLEAAGFGPELEFALSRLASKAGERA